MNQHKLPAVLGIVILAGILIYIVKMNEQTKQEIGNQDRRLTATKGDQTDQKEEIGRLRAELDGLKEHQRSAEKKGELSGSKLQKGIENLLANMEKKSDEKFITKTNAEALLETLREQIDQAVSEQSNTAKEVARLRTELDRTSKELKALKAAPSPAPKPAAVTSSGQPK